MDQANHKGTVLLVDDEQIVRESLKEWLTMEGFDAHAAGGGEEALSFLKQMPVNVAVLDIKMPGMDGIELLGEINKRYPETMIVMMTAHATIESAVDCMRNGAYDYVIKPFPPEKLTNIISHGIALQNLKKAQEQLEQQVASADVYLKRAETLMNVGKFASQTSSELGDFLQKMMADITTSIKPMENYPQIKKDIEKSSHQIVNYLSTLNKISTVTQTFEATDQEISLNDVVSNSLLLAKRRPDVIQANITTKLSTPLPVTQAKIWSLVQVCNNLIYNAVHATPDFQPIVISTGTEEKNYVVLQISDHGIGIAENIITQIFDPFFSQWPNSQNVGLGLTISKNIIESFNGKIVIDSQVGEYTNVKILLPISEIIY